MAILLSEAKAWNLVAEGYARYAVGELAPYAEEALSLAVLKAGDRVLDVASGPGTLSFLAAKTAGHVTAVDFSPKMVAEFKAELAKRKLANVDVHEGDGQALSFKDGSFDLAFSMFGLMFFPDRAKGFRELYRTLKPGGKAVVSGWAPLSRSPLMQALFGAVKAMTPERPVPPPVPRPLEDPTIFKAEMEAAGFGQVQVKSITKAFAAKPVAQFWQEMRAGSLPLVLLREEIGETAWAQKEKIALVYLEKLWPEISYRLTSDAWLGIGTK